MPRIPATKMKSPARVPRFHVPVGLIAPSGESGLDATRRHLLRQDRVPRRHQERYHRNDPDMHDKLL
jgi:hypothetical protein